MAQIESIQHTTSSYQSILTLFNLRNHPIKSPLTKGYGNEKPETTRDIKTKFVPKIILTKIFLNLFCNSSKISLNFKLKSNFGFKVGTV